ncbi:MAG: diguanylate cyclase [Fervidobacterium sp.]|uniref:diguanylate cyclase n=1 Tax=Fervidobacterium sp. TaxID=1871331 RepID=UPI00404AEE5B
MIRIFPRNFVENFDEFVIGINSYTFSSRFLVPTTVEISKKSDSCLVFFNHFGEKPIWDEKKNLRSFSELERTKLLKSLLRIAKFVFFENIPPFPAYTLYDIYGYATEFYFSPPFVFNNEVWKQIVEDQQNVKDYIFVDEEFLRTGQFGKESTLKILADLIDFFDVNKEFTHISGKLKSFNVSEKDFVSHGNELEFAQTLAEKMMDESSRREIFCLDTKGVYKVFKDYASVVEYYIRKFNQYAVIYIGNDFTNIVRNLLWKYQNFMTNDEKIALNRCLYSVCKFDSVVEELTPILRRFKKLILIIRDLDNCNPLIKRFLRILDELKIETAVITFNSSHADITYNLNIDISNTVQVFSRNETAIEGHILENTDFYVALLGDRFSKHDLSILEKVLGKDLEENIYRLQVLGLLRTDDGEYIVSEKLKEHLSSLDEKDLKELHLKLAKEYGMSISPYTLDLKKAAEHYEKAGSKNSAAVAYLMFIRNAINSYVFSQTALLNAFEALWNILQDINRTDLYSFHKLRLEFEYRTSKKVFDDVLLKMETGIYGYLKAYELFVNEKYAECIDFINGLLNSESYTDYVRYNLIFLKERAYLIIHDKLEKEDELLSIAQNIGVDSLPWIELKAKIFWLLGSSKSYSDSRKARDYLQIAEPIAKEYGLEYILIDIYNTLGIVYDGTLLSTMYFQEAIRTAQKIGYTKRALVPRLNLVRELLYFGKFEDLERELSGVSIGLSNELSPSDMAYFNRLRGMIYTYLRRYEDGLKHIEEAYEIEKQHNLPHASLRSRILHELICGNYENAKKIIIENYDDQAIHTRGFEFLIKLVLAKDDNEFLHNWLAYKNSPYSLLREEILFIFSEQLTRLDPKGFIDEITKWERLYGSQLVKLSLLYVLLAKANYYKALNNRVKSELTKFEISRLLSEMGIRESFPEYSIDEYSERIPSNEFYPIADLLYVLKSVDPDVSLEDFVRITSNVMVNVFKPNRLYVSVLDKKYNFDISVGLLPKFSEKSYLNFEPVEVYIKEKIDKDCEYAIYMSSDRHVHDVTEQQKLMNNVILLEELFSGQLRGLIYRERATMDPLTGLYNRWKFNSIFDEYMQNSKTSGEEFSVFLCDVDSFKKINDTYGHLKGDEVLRVLAKILKENIESAGLVARYGGEEFVGILKGDKDKCVTLCENVRRIIEDRSAEVLGFRVTMSFGVSSFKERETKSEILGLADQRLYKAKELGKNRVCYD